MTSILRNPYHRAGAIVSRLAVCSATLVWSLIVLTVDNALAPTSYGSIMTRYIPEDAWGFGGALVSGSMLYRIIAKSKPHPIGAVGYGAMLLWWGFVAAVLLVSQRPVRPTATACVLVIVAMAIHAFVANPRRGPDDHAPRDR